MDEQIFLKCILKGENNFDNGFCQGECPMQYFCLSGQIQLLLKDFEVLGIKKSGTSVSHRGYYNLWKYRKDSNEKASRGEFYCGVCKKRIPRDVVLCDECDRKDREV